MVRLLPTNIFLLRPFLLRVVRVDATEIHESHLCRLEIGQHNPNSFARTFLLVCLPL